jgi:hypothetical protein
MVAPIAEARPDQHPNRKQASSARVREFAPIAQLVVHEAAIQPNAFFCGEAIL